MPIKQVHCKQCGAGISGYDFSERMAKLRRHYASKHPRKWKESIKRGVKARTK